MNCRRKGCGHSKYAHKKGKGKCTRTVMAYADVELQCECKEFLGRTKRNGK